MLKLIPSNRIYYLIFICGYVGWFAMVQPFNISYAMLKIANTIHIYKCTYMIWNKHTPHLHCIAHLGIHFIFSVYI